MSTQPSQFPAFSRLLHWTMAAMVLTMLCIGVAMVASLANYHVLVSIHRPLGIAILILVVVRFVNRLLNPPPPFPSTMPGAERLVATASEFAMWIFPNAARPISQGECPAGHSGWYSELYS